MIDEKTWTIYLAKAGVKPAQVSAWSPAFTAALQPDAFGQGRSELVEFLVQVLHETAYLRRLSENLNYSVYGLLTTFGAKRISEEQAKRVGRIDGVQAANQAAIANIVYGGNWGRINLGNTEEGDGWRFKGSGMIQTTGRANFTYLSKTTGIDVLTDPDKLQVPGPDAVICAVAQWKKLVKPSALASEVETRRAINGGTLGIEDCRIIRVKLRSIFAM